VRIRYRLFFFGIAFTLAAGLMRQVHFKGVINDYSPSNVPGCASSFHVQGPCAANFPRAAGYV